MKILGLTQRVEKHSDYLERRDCLDQRWFSLVDRLGFIPVPLPNIARTKVTELAEALNLEALILTGGNTLLAQDKSATDIAPERDEFEAALLQWAIAKSVPVVGVCRGMQSINTYLNGATSKVSEHARTQHVVNFCGPLEHKASRVVNSYHNWGLHSSELAPDLIACATTQDGTIEAFQHARHRISAIMWHPEREDPASDDDLNLLVELLTT